MHLETLSSALGTAPLLAVSTADLVFVSAAVASFVVVVGPVAPRQLVEAVARSVVALLPVVLGFGPLAALVGRPAVALAEPAVDPVAVPAPVAQVVLVAVAEALAVVPPAELPALAPFVAASPAVAVAASVPVEPSAVLLVPAVSATPDALVHAAVALHVVRLATAALVHPPSLRCALVGWPSNVHGHHSC
jgi:hypothetical protein